MKNQLKRHAINHRQFRGTLLAIFAILTVMLQGPAVAGRLSEQFSRFDQASTLSPDHRFWDGFLKRYLKRSASGIYLVDYGAVAGADRKGLAAYLVRLQRTPVARLRKTAAMAFWINLYNALTVSVVLDHYPVKSIRDIAISPGLFTKGPWRRKLVTVERQQLSLDDIEHQILRPVWRDRRIHYALNCASIGCPDLATISYRANNLNAMLERAARRYIGHPRGVGGAAGGETLTLSSIYKWYKADFGTRAELLAHLRRYAGPSLKKRLNTAPRIAGFAYDWSLNDAATAMNR